MRQQLGHRLWDRVPGSLSCGGWREVTRGPGAKSEPGRSRLPGETLPNSWKGEAPRAPVPGTRQRRARNTRG